MKYIGFRVCQSKVSMEKEVSASACDCDSKWLRFRFDFRGSSTKSAYGFCAIFTDAFCAFSVCQIPSSSFSYPSYSYSYSIYQFGFVKTFDYVEAARTRNSIKRIFLSNADLDSLRISCVCVFFFAYRVFSFFSVFFFAN